MSGDQETSDEAAIRKLIGNHFEGLKWDRFSKPDWERFSADFLPQALLFPSARPVQVRP